MCQLFSEPMKVKSKIAYKVVAKEGNSYYSAFLDIPLQTDKIEEAVCTQKDDIPEYIGFHASSLTIAKKNLKFFKSVYPNDTYCIIKVKLLGIITKGYEDMDMKEVSYKANKQLFIEEYIGEL